MMDSIKSLLNKILGIFFKPEESVDDDEHVDSVEPSNSNSTLDSPTSNIAEPKEAGWDKLGKETPPTSLEGADRLIETKQKFDIDQKILQKQSQNEISDSDIAQGALYKDPKKQDVFEPGPHPQNQDGSLSQPRKRKR